VELSGLGVTLFTRVEADRLRLLPEYEGAPDAHISGTPIAFAKLGVMQQSRGALFSGEVTIRGDVELGRRLRDLLEGMEIDWEEHLSRLTGDIVAHQVGNVARGVATWARQSADALARDAGDYLQYETQQLPGRAEVEEFMQRVDGLRNDVERLEARVQRLQQRASDVKPGAM
jgi:ubiquinone biosynthesis protein UbiJ